MTGLEAVKRINDSISRITNRELRRACYIVTNDARFTASYGSSGHHHAYPGGLAVHTWEVLEYAVHMASHPSRSGTNPDVVIAAAVFHDYMKVKDYDGAQKTLYRDLVRHLSGSHAEFVKAISRKDIPADVVVQIEHAILAHHGRKEWGSPVEPQTPEAYILHAADMMSREFGPGAKQLQEA